ncbi:MAG TPA: DNA-binding response regulator, partial [Anaerolineaceae bacterium]|nr:DNA-binding response regulator [Anaerolineaceae bacterium]
MPEKILVVDDEISLQETVAYNLKKQGYDVQTTGDGAEALELARELQPDLIILDVMLPGLDGFEICRILRREMTTPVLMLTARDDEIDRVVGLEVGADDYMAKPFSMRELIARVKAMLRRVRLIREEVSEAETGEGKPKQEVLEFGNLRIDITRREITVNGEVVAFKPKEYELLTFLAQHQGQVLSREF